MNKNKWYMTDDGCCQYMRNQGIIYEMIKYIWLDTTPLDRSLGRHEYVVVYHSIYIDEYSFDDMEECISACGYTMRDLITEYGLRGAERIIAKCILEEQIMCDSCVETDCDSEEEAIEFIETYIGRN